MFNKDKNSKDNQAETIIGPSVKVEGDFTGEGNVIVEGVVNGNLTTNQHLIVGPRAKIAANVVAASAVISGEVLGNIKVDEELELRGTSRVNGDLETPLLSIEKGAVVNGKCCMVRKKEPAKLSDKPNEDENK
ncbi:MAG TPA: polymer-forming cytoskeletal protein [Patescibacteria group bacterium]